jgi:galactose oxidase
MFCPGTSTLADGRILITGGQTSIVTSIYNPWTDVWSRGTRMNVGRGYQTQITLSDGTVFVFGGSWSGGLGNKDGEIYSELGGVGRWTMKYGIKAVEEVITNDKDGIYRSDSHMWLFEATNGNILLAGPAKRMHWINITGNGTVTPTV